MRVNLKVVIVVFCTVVLFATFAIWTRCGGNELPLFAREENNNVAPEEVRAGFGPDSDGAGLDEIDCHINGEYSVSCRRERAEVYLPFSFLHKYFEVYGKLVSYDGLERFEWSHSYSKVYYPKGKYDPRGVFLYFENYNVELRERVKCVSATEGVPVSTQWESQGYYYPTQIAQFGLSHYSKNLTEPEPRRRSLEGGGAEGEWSLSPGATLQRSFDPRHHTQVLNFQTEAGGDGGATLRPDHVLDFVLSCDIRLSAADNSSLSVALQNRENGRVVVIRYTCSHHLLYAQDEDIHYGLGCDKDGWQRLTRDLLVDLQKGLVLFSRPKRKIARIKYKVTSITLRGSGALDNLTLSSSDHLAQFYASARWFVRHQDAETGGWANTVRRKGAPGMKDLQPGWYSAMGQGHGISVLARAYHLSGGDQTYLEGALRALKPFHVASKEGGVLAHFLGLLPWYEEYPTTPPSFVLNGFIYSLIGLYDLLTLAPPAKAQEATQLFHEGMDSLRRLLPLFDTGAGTHYDLRHVALGSAPNTARWDYHATHVNQLLLLTTLDSDPVLAATAHRWAGYMAGKRAPHN